jgi:hypothetical protein
MFLTPPAERDLLHDLCTRRTRQLDLREVSLDVEDTAAGQSQAVVIEQQLALDELGHLCLLLILGLHTEITRRLIHFRAMNDAEGPVIASMFYERLFAEDAITVDVVSMRLTTQ